MHVDHHDHLKRQSVVIFITMTMMIKDGHVSHVQRSIWTGKLIEFRGNNFFLWNNVCRLLFYFSCADSTRGILILICISFSLSLSPPASFLKSQDRLPVGRCFICRFRSFPDSLSLFLSPPVERSDDRSFSCRWVSAASSSTHVMCVWCVRRKRNVYSMIAFLEQMRQDETRGKEREKKK